MKIFGKKERGPVMVFEDPAVGMALGRRIWVRRMRDELVTKLSWRRWLLAQIYGGLR
jgi:hypothetical protein